MIKIRKIYTKLFLIIALLILITSSCNILDNDNKPDPPAIDPIGGMPSPYQDVSISPDGQKLIFYRIKYTYVSRDGLNIQYDPDSTGIWICNIDGTELKLIYKNDSDFIGRPQFIPNSDYILFNLNNQIVKAQYKGSLIENSELEFLTTSGNNFFPSVNNDGSEIVYDSNKDSPNGMNFIWRMKIDGSMKTRIAYEPQEGEIRMPYFSPITNIIAHIRWIGVGTPEIFLMDEYGNNITRITNNNSEDYEPRLNYADNMILFLRNGSLITKKT
jgi:Tol biopolymer transport system component